MKFDFKDLMAFGMFILALRQYAKNAPVTHCLYYVSMQKTRQ